MKHVQFCSLARMILILAMVTSLFIQSSNAAESTDAEPIMNSAEEFVKAFNQHQVDSLVGMYATNAEVLSRDGSRLSGTKEIRESFEALFQANPQIKLAVQIGSVKLLTSNLALEEGTATLFDDGKTPSYVSRYILLHSKVKDTWKIAASKVTEDEVLNRAAVLDQLAWMEGEWIDEGATSSIHWNCQRSEDGNYLIRKFDVRFADGRSAKGTQRIGWDPVRKQIRSWAFDENGGFAEAHWTKVGEVWVNKSTGYQPDGTAVSSTNYVIPIRKDRYMLRSAERIAGREKVDDVEAVVVRRGPKPGA